MFSQTATVYVIDDDAQVQSSVRAVLESMNYQVQSYGNVRQFLADFDSTISSCLILDQRLPDLSGLELQRLLAQRGIRTPIIMMSGYGDVSIAVQAIKSGAIDFIEKPFHPRVLLDRVHTALATDTRLRKLAAAEQEITQRLAALSPRERDVLKQLVEGRSAKQIAAALGISPKTIDNHRAKVLEKMRVDSTIELVRMLFGQQLSAPVTRYDLSLNAGSLAAHVTWPVPGLPTGR